MDRIKVVRSKTTALTLSFLVLIFFLAFPNYVYAQEGDFPDTPFDTSIKTDYDISSPQEISEPSGTAATYTYDLVIAIEQQTRAQVPNIESIIQSHINQVNQDYTNGELGRQFTIRRFDPDFNHNAVTSCNQIKDKDGTQYYMPEDFCDQTELPTYIFITVDMNIDSLYFSQFFLQHQSLYIGRYEEYPFDSIYTQQSFTHELGHSVADLTDQYFMKVKPENDLVTGEGYNFFDGYLMNDVEGNPSVFHRMDKEISDREGGLLLGGVSAIAAMASWVDYQPDQDNILFIADTNGNPLAGAVLNIYESEFSFSEAKNVVDSTPERIAVADENGEYSLGPNMLGEWGIGDEANAIKAFLIRVDFGGFVEYKWLNSWHVMEQYFDGDGHVGRYEVRLSYDLNCTYGNCCASTPMSDLNGDGVVSASDYGKMVAEINTLPEGLPNPGGDIDADGDVDYVDLGVLFRQYSEGTTSVIEKCAEVGFLENQGAPGEIIDMVVGFRPNDIDVKDVRIPFRETYNSYSPSGNSSIRYRSWEEGSFSELFDTNTAFGGVNKCVESYGNNDIYDVFAHVNGSLGPEHALNQDLFSLKFGIEDWSILGDVIPVEIPVLDTTYGQLNCNSTVTDFNDYGYNVVEASSIVTVVEGTSPTSTPVPESTPTPTTTPTLECKVWGCSGELCVPADLNIDSPCVYRDYFVCFENATCEEQEGGMCGWTTTPELEACIQAHPTPTPYELN